MDHIPIFTDPVEIAVEELVKGSHLTNVRDFSPIIQLDELSEGDRLPLVTAETVDYRIKEDGVNASVDFFITIWDYIPQRDSCTSLEEVKRLSVYMTKAYAEDLLEITEALVSPSIGDQLFPDADYSIQGDRIILPRYGPGVFSSKVDAKNSKLKDRLLGATIQGRLEGVIKWICCTKGNFELS